jgi:hypothetical protein
MALIQSQQDKRPHERPIGFDLIKGSLPFPAGTQLHVLALELQQLSKWFPTI